MCSTYLRELRYYSIDFLSVKFNVNLEKTQEILNYLSRFNIITFNGEKYVFNYVGIIIFEDLVINCFPKYIKDDSNIKNDFKLIMKVIKKFNEYFADEDYKNHQLGESPFNLLSMMIFFIEDYYENGLYTNFKNNLEINGTGEILWNETIYNDQVMIYKNKPYYFELLTKYKFNDNFDFFKLLHKYIITECCKRLDELDLLDIFDLTYVELTDINLEDFGDMDFIITKIEQELNSEFNSHKQKLLKYMKNYLLKQNSFIESNFFTLYGSSSFFSIWEKICTNVFDNKLNKKLQDLKFPNDIQDYYDLNLELKKIIPKTKWMFNGHGPIYKSRLKPDLVTFNNETKEFFILDAKYYDLSLNDDELSGQPELYSITKQYLYELAYKEFIRLAGFRKVNNVFLFPTQNDSCNMGYVELDFMKNYSLDLTDIQIVKLSASMMYDLFLNNKRISVESLDVF